jgi:hypothetical protein
MMCETLPYLAVQTHYFTPVYTVSNLWYKTTGFYV